MEHASASEDGMNSGTELGVVGLDFDYDVEELIASLSARSKPLVLFGAGDLGKLAHHALTRRGVTVDYFCDGSVLKQRAPWRGVPTLAPFELAELGPDIHLVICCNYLAAVALVLDERGITRRYSCLKLLEASDQSTVDFMQPLDVRRKIALHRREILKTAEHDIDVLALKYIDIVVTEACSMKCVDCSNLMQYYEAPKHSELPQLVRGVDRIMEAIDWIDEFRVLGGEPFVNKQVHRVVEQLVSYETAGRVVIYTNATIVPKGENLQCLKHPKVVVDITNYGALSRNYDALLATLETNGIAYLTKIPTWTDSGRIQYRQRSTNELADMFMNCCVNDVLTLLNGKLYRCPFSANGTNLGAIPSPEEDVIDLTCEAKDASALRAELRRLYGEKKYLTACSYCNGRDFRTPKIEAGIQTKRPLPVPQPR